MCTHINYQITRLNVATTNHGIRKISLDCHCIPESKEMPSLAEIINVDLGTNHYFGGYNIDSYLNVIIDHFGFDMRVVF